MKNVWNLVYKDLKILVHPVTLLYCILSMVMTFIPMYPAFIGPFYILIGVMITITTEGQYKDKEFCGVLPVSKADCIKARMLTVMILELATIVLTVPCAILSVILLDMQLMGMENSFTSLSGVLLGYAAANALMISADFRGQFKAVVPSLIGMVLYFVICFAMSSLWHIPGLEFLAGNSAANLIRQLPLLIAAILIYLLAAYLTCKASVKNYEKAVIG